MRFKGVNHLTIEDRKLIKKGLDQGLTYREIGESLDRSRAVIRREANRLGSFENYIPEKAQADFISKQRLSGIKRGSPLYLKIKQEENLP